MAGGGLMQLVAYGMQEIYIDYGHTNYYSGNSTTFHRGKVSRFRGKHNFYQHIKKPGNKLHKKSERINIRERCSQIDEYDGLRNNYRYITTIDKANYPKIFNNDRVYINKGIYINNKRKYKNFELLFQYSKSDYYEYLTSTLNNFF